MEEHFDVNAEDLKSALEGIVLWFQGPLFLFFKNCTKRSTEGFDFETVISSTSLTPEANAARHRKGAEKLSDLVSSISKGDRLSLNQEGLVVYADGDEIFRWEEPKLAQRFISFGNQDS